MDLGNFSQYTENAGITRFHEAYMPKSFQRNTYNDDISIESFISFATHYAGKQRRGVTDEHLECLTPQEHTEQALRAPFFLSLRTPVPGSILNAALIVDRSHTNAVLSFWGDQPSNHQLVIEDPTPFGII